MADLKLAYGKKDDIQTSINNGVIPPGSLIYTEDSNEILFYNLDCKLCSYKEKYKFTSKLEAEDWINKYNCHGEIISVHENNGCNIYVVGYDNKLTSVNEIDISWDDIKDKPDIISDKQYIYKQTTASNNWKITHNLNKYPSVTVVDSSGNTVMGDISYIDMNNINIKFTGSFSGKAYCN